MNQYTLRVRKTFLTICILSIIFFTLLVQAQEQTALDVLRDISVKHRVIFHIDKRVKLDRKVHSIIDDGVNTSIENQLRVLLKTESYILSYNDLGRVKEIFILPGGQETVAGEEKQYFHLDPTINRAKDSSLAARSATQKYVTDNKKLIAVLGILSADPMTKSPRLIHLDVAELKQQMQRYADKGLGDDDSVAAINFPLGDGLDFDMKATEIRTEDNISIWYGQTLIADDYRIEQKIVDLYLHENTYIAGQIKVNERVFRVRPVDNNDSETLYVLYEVAVEKLPPLH